MARKYRRLSYKDRQTIERMSRDGSRVIEQIRHRKHFNKTECGNMKKVDFEKINTGDLVQVPRVQFAPMRYGWNGWLFSSAVVIRKG